jgi:hypothetical protein
VFPMTLLRRGVLSLNAASLMRAQRTAKMIRSACDSRRAFGSPDGTKKGRVEIAYETEEEGFRATNDGEHSKETFTNKIGDAGQRDFLARVEAFVAPSVIARSEKGPAVWLDDSRTSYSARHEGRSNRPGRDRRSRRERPFRILPKKEGGDSEGDTRP